MRAPAILLGGALAAMGFGWWGLNTVAGRAMFDEMAGMIPFAVGVAGAAAAPVALFLLWRSHKR